MTSKAQRQSKIINLIQSEHVSSQEQISKVLESEGIVSTQATVSRDLEEIGAVKVRLPGGESGYAIPETAKRPGSDGTLSKTLKQYVLTIEEISPLIVIKTPLGCADVTCAAIDSSNMAEIAGSIAGQDTIFLAMAKDVNIEDFVKKLSELADIDLA
ncbi:MAG TPA: ArgR family transcriptional regulator [Acidimicrobiia bacterium]|nr:ArgR family transcriptional regulator [Acidimicrobiia bacterium]